jgi:hypothetical protein
VILHKDYTDWDRHEELVSDDAGDRKAERQQGGRWKLRTFWTQLDTGSGRAEFRGWDCDDDASKLAAAQGETAGEGSTACHRFADSRERSRSSRFGWEAHKATYHCAADCASYFLFHDRLAKVEGATVNSRPDQELVAAAWQMLSRQNADAQRPPPLISELSEARAQMKICVQLAEELQEGIAHTGDNERPHARPADVLLAAPIWEREQESRHTASVQLYVLRTSCLRAADIATRIDSVAPGDASPVLEATTQVLEQLEGGRRISFDD